MEGSSRTEILHIEALTESIRAVVQPSHIQIANSTPHIAFLFVEAKVKLELRLAGWVITCCMSHGS